MYTTYMYICVCTPNMMWFVKAHTHTHTHTHTHLYIVQTLKLNVFAITKHKYVCMFLCMFLCMYVCERPPSRIGSSPMRCIISQQYVPVCVWVYMYVFLYVCVSVCMYLCVYILWLIEDPPKSKNPCSSKPTIMAWWIFA